VGCTRRRDCKYDVVKKTETGDVNKDPPALLVPHSGKGKTCHEVCDTTLVKFFWYSNAGLSLDQLNRLFAGALSLITQIQSDFARASTGAAGLPTCKM